LGPSCGSPEPLEQRLLHVPWTFSVAYVTLLNVQRRFSTHGVENVGLPVALVVPRQRGVDCTSTFIGFSPSDRSVPKKTARSYCSRSSELKPPFVVRSQSVQSLSPGMKNAGFFSESKKASPCE
jgi:hypothetical protein